AIRSAPAAHSDLAGSKPYRVCGRSRQGSRRSRMKRTCRPARHSQELTLYGLRRGRPACPMKLNELQGKVAPASQNSWVVFDMPMESSTYLPLGLELPIVSMG